MTTWKKLKEWPELYLERIDDSGVARVVLNRPEKRNSLTGTLALAFAEALEIVRGDPELKVVISKGAGTTYSSGLDLNFLREESYRPLRDWDRPGPTIALTEAMR